MKKLKVVAIVNVINFKTKFFSKAFKNYFLI